MEDAPVGFGEIALESREGFLVGIGGGAGLRRTSGLFDGSFGACIASKEPGCAGRLGRVGGDCVVMLAVERLRA